MSLKIKRVYAQAEKSDGIRILVDRLWPRGISKDQARIEEWLKDIAPSTTLRKWFDHRADKWEEFQTRYRIELNTTEKKDILGRLRAMSRNTTVTLLFGAKDEEHNNARVVASIVQRKSSR